jgi:hypothetical protein
MMDKFEKRVDFVWNFTTVMSAAVFNSFISKGLWSWENLIISFSLFGAIAIILRPIVFLITGKVRERFLIIK